MYFQIFGHPSIIHSSLVINFVLGGINFPFDEKCIELKSINQYVKSKVKIEVIEVKLGRWENKDRWVSTNKNNIQSFTAFLVIIFLSPIKQLTLITYYPGQTYKTLLTCESLYWFIWHKLICSFAYLLSFSMYFSFHWNFDLRKSDLWS